MVDHAYDRSQNLRNNLLRTASLLSASPGKKVP